MFALFLASVFYQKVVSYLQMQIEKVWLTHAHKRIQKQCIVQNLEKPKKQNFLAGRSFGFRSKDVFFVYLEFFLFFGFWTDFLKTCKNNPCKKPRKT